MSNFPDVRPARRVLVVGSAVFAVMFALNVVATALAFAHGDAGRWLNLLRLGLNLPVVALLWKGYVQLSVLAERAGIYKVVLERDLPALQAQLQQHLHHVQQRPAESPEPTPPEAASSGTVPCS
jgi:hypothetical protein